MYVKLIISENGLLFCKPNSHLMKISCFGDTVSQPFLKPFSKRYTPLGYVSICFIPFYVYFLWLHCYYYYHCIHIQIQELLPLKMMTKKGKGFICSLDSSEVRMLVKVENWHHLAFWSARNCTELSVFYYIVWILNPRIRYSFE